MGKNSVSPSIIAIMIACNVFMKMYVKKSRVGAA
jgi:hypothetical protein